MRLRRMSKGRMDASASRWFSGAPMRRPRRFANADSDMRLVWNIWTVRILSYQYAMGAHTI